MSGQTCQLDGLLGVDITENARFLILDTTNRKRTENDRKPIENEPKTIENGAETKHLNSTSSLPGPRQFESNSNATEKMAKRPPMTRP